MQGIPVRMPARMATQLTQMCKDNLSGKSSLQAHSLGGDDQAALALWAWHDKPGSTLALWAWHDKPGSSMVEKLFAKHSMAQDDQWLNSAGPLGVA
eukprot:1156080-Pelagomonas_calceolata.AAC.6